MSLRDELALLPEDVREALERRYRRSARYRALSFLWGKSSRKRIRACLHRRVAGSSYVELGVADGRASMRGVQRCASIHACPVCAPGIRDGRAREIEEAAREHLTAGGGLLFLTVTFPHDAGESLGQLLDVLVEGWQKVRRSSSWKAWAAQEGLSFAARPGAQARPKLGEVRALEVTHGASGWHPHLHVLVFTRRPLDQLTRDAFGADVSMVWREVLTARGRRTKHVDRHGVDVQAVTNVGGDEAGIGGYLAKVGDGSMIDYELARTDLKVGTRSRTQWQILRDLVTPRYDRDTGERLVDADDLDLWWEWEYASYGRNAITWSHGLKAHYGVDELSDEELAAAEKGHRTRLWLDPDSWRRVVARCLVAPLMAAVEADDERAALDVLVVCGCDMRDVWWGQLPGPAPG